MATPDKFVFSSKSDTLTALSLYPELNIPKVFTVTVADWNADREGMIGKMTDFAAGKTLAVRSSCRREDSEELSGAGAFLSLLSVEPTPAALEQAIEQVIASYGRAEDDDQVLIQPMIENAAVTGVMMTRVLSDGAPYYVINYDDESGRTDTITGGQGVNKTVYVYREVRSEDFDSPRLRSFVGLARRLEELCGSNSLDIEFCLDGANVLHLLQVRPMCTRRHWLEQGGASVRPVADFVQAVTGPSSDLFGRRSILGVMPDWNPAEMIGVLPRPLAASLYRNLITSRVWRASRATMGYKAAPAVELMLMLYGRPYIDVRASLNSFLPDGLDY